MIARLRGELLESAYTSCVIDAGGVGYDVAIPLSTFEKLPQPGGAADLFIHTQVREDAITLFGFATRTERDLFRQLISVSGIGGKLALNVLSTMPVPNFCAAIAAGDLKLLSRISGIGKRTAERLVVELKERLSDIGGENGPAETVLSPGMRSVVNDAALALEQLGFKRDAVDKTLQRILSENPEEECTCEVLLRRALQLLNF